MPSISHIIARDGSSGSPTSTGPDNSSTTTKILYILVVLILFGLFTVTGLYLLRLHKTKRNGPTSDDALKSSPPTSSIFRHRRLKIRATSRDQSSLPLGSPSEKETLMSEQSPESPTGSLPEIRITFPEEEDDGGRRKSGRIVVVKIGEQGAIGLEPYSDEHLPAYEKENSTRFQSLDLDRIGGLKESEKV